jgi:alpha-N-arabinofuranosidase
MKTFHNPILKGFYPDPSICRVGEDYYLVTSSFCYFPGIPIFHSKDLVHWEQIGHAIHRKEQLDYNNCAHSGGLWAPTIRYHAGTFYVINTFVSEDSEETEGSICRNYIVKTDDIYGDWSKAIFIEGADGIDPSLFFDEDGRIWYMSNRIPDTELWEGHKEIYLAELDPVTLQIKGDKTVIWDGAKTFSNYIEAPHIYKRKEWYYLLVAEGGTFTNHSVMMARSKIITGPYEICPRNPIVTHRHKKLTSEIAVTGHADMVETQNHEWWMVLLAVRPYGDFLYNLGRETFLVPISWEPDEWPIIDNEEGIVHLEERLPNLVPSVRPGSSPNDNFESSKLSFLWNTLRHSKEDFYSLSERPGFLRLYAQKNEITQNCTSSFIGRRQQHKSFFACAAMEAHLQADNEEAGLVILQNHKYQFQYILKRCWKNLSLHVYEVRNGQISELAAREIISTERIYLGIQGVEDKYSFYYGHQEHEVYPLYTDADGSILSSTIAGGFVGTYMGMYATSHGEETEAYADFDWFEYYEI